MRIVMVCRGEPGRWSGTTERMLVTVRALASIGQVELLMLTRSADGPFGADDLGCPVRYVRALGRRVLPTDLAIAVAGWRPRRLGTGQFRQQRALVAEAIGPDPDVVWTMGARQYLSLPRGLASRVPVVADLVDVEDERNVALAAQAAGWRWLRTFVARREQAAIRRAFSAIARRASVTLLASPVDQRRLGAAGVDVLPNGYALKGEPAGTAPRADHPMFVLAGLFSYRPNADGVRWLVNEIWPRVRSALPDAELRLVGHGLPADAFAGVAGVVVRGAVPLMRPELAGALACLAPLRSGAGTRIKVLEGWANRIPVVSTTIGAEGLGGEHEWDLLLADTAVDFAAQMVRLATDEALRAGLVESGARRWIGDFSPEPIARQVHAAVRRATSGRGG